jgi:energy-coupling factor transporter ATP-binding protein EcfA2
MRLRRLRLRGFRGLEDVTIHFPDPVLDYNGADVRFFVGRNGSGKSTALEALALIFSHLAADAHPGFDFQLDYHVHGAEVRLTTLSDDGVKRYGRIEASRREPGDEHYRPVALGSSNVSLLPDRIIGYSTGPTSGMGDALFKAIQRLEEEIRIDEGDEDEDLEPSDTIRHQRESFLANPQTLFLDANGSTWAALAALLSPRRNELLGLVLEPVGLDSARPLLSFSLQIASEWDALLPEYEHKEFREFLDLTAMVTLVEHADDGGSHLVAAFDVNEALVGEHLPKLIGTPLTFLETLVTWSRRRVLQRVRLVMRKHGVDEPITDNDLSDGELFYLSRYALLFVASDTRESLLLLDEPETHFNDNWKIELVDDMTRALGGDGKDGYDGHQLVIATHSSLTLTDAEAALVQLFVCREGKIEVLDPPTSTFGAAPGDLAQLLFGLDAPVGNFAERTLRGALERGDPEELDQLSSAMGPGYLRLAVQSRLENADGTSLDQST